MIVSPMEKQTCKIFWQKKMYEIKVINPCSCANKRKAWTKELKFDSKEEALEIANKMSRQGNEKFCKRHQFFVNENGNTIEIETQTNR